MTTVFDWSPTFADNDDADDGFTQAEGMAASAVNDSARAMMARLRAFLTVLGGAATYGGIGNAYTITSPVGHDLEAYVDGLLVCLKPNADNTGNATVAIDGLAAKSVRLPNGANVASGDLKSGGKYLLAYDATAGYFQAIGTLAGGSFQPLDTTLTGIAALSIVAGSVIVGSGADSFTVASSTSFGRGLWNTADLAAYVTALGGASAVRTAISLVPGTDIQGYDADTAKTDVAQSWTAGQTFGGSDANVATFYRVGAAAKTRWLESTNNNAWGARNDANTLKFDYNGTDVFLISSAGRAFFGPASSLYALGVGYNGTRAAAAQVGYMGATDSATPDIVFSNASGSEIARMSNSGAFSTFGAITAGGVAVLTLAGGTLSGDLTINKGAGGASLLFVGGANNQGSNIGLRGNAGQSRGVIFYTGASSARWYLETSSTAESGANAGSDLVLSAWSDAGGYLSAPLQINRATGISDFIGVRVGGKAALSHDGAYTSGKVTFSTSDPSGGSNGDIWFKYA